MRVVKVPLGARSYAIWIGTGLLPRLGAECKRLGLGRRCAVISDRNVAPLYAPRLLRSLRAAGFDAVLLTVPAGERTKNLTTVRAC